MASSCLFESATPPSQTSREATNFTRLRQASLGQSRLHMLRSSIGSLLPPSPRSASRLPARNRHPPNRKSIATAGRHNLRLGQGSVIATLQDSDGPEASAPADLQRTYNGAAILHDDFAVCGSSAIQRCLLALKTEAVRRVVRFENLGQTKISVFAREVPYCKSVALDFSNREQQPATSASEALSLPCSGLWGLSASHEQLAPCSYQYTALGKQNSFLCSGKRKRSA